MKIALGSDHRGYQTKVHLKAFLEGLGHQVVDCGSDSDRACDYPDYTVPPCRMVVARQADRAILLCGTGIGMTMVANKVAGVRAALCHDELTAEMSRRHNDANVLCLPADLLGDELIRRMVEAWLKAPFDAGRHARRVQKIMAVEQTPSDQGRRAEGQAASNECRTPNVTLGDPPRRDEPSGNSGRS
jgi:ribose 5-phosphate isomerase B